MAQCAHCALPGDAKRVKRARKILPLVKRKHWLLVTLLIANAASMEALPIFLDRIVGPLAAVLISVTAVLIFGEILPQAACSRYGLAIGAFLSPLVWTLMFALSPLGYPLAKMLDWMLGEDHGTLYRRAELRELVGMHAGVVALESADEDGAGGGAMVLMGGAKHQRDIKVSSARCAVCLPSDALTRRATRSGWKSSE